ncbi:uncharacterized protein LOC127857438 [Dreissena polymorpha]|uniref:uncharacterized protein LOC127857438 n=1 Tax=Dreissena polymorpha TaxID=45954 RepID=UPI002264D240|nr:uncharacterized protein LOC127857438 [Dreissena polymorpha]
MKFIGFHLDNYGPNIFLNSLRLYGIAVSLISTVMNVVDAQHFSRFKENTKRKEKSRDSGVKKSALNQAVWLEDITQNAKTRNLDLGLPETLQVKLRRTGQQDLILKLVENKRLNQNAPTGSLDYNYNYAFEINPTREMFVSRSLADNKLNPHMLSRVVNRTGKRIISDIARRDHISEDAPLPTSAADDVDLYHPKPERGRDDSGVVNDIVGKELAKELRQLLMKSELDAFSEKLHLRRQERQSTKTYALEILVGADPSVWKKYYAKAVGTATLTKDQATELFIRKRFSHIINGVGYIGRSCVFVNVCTFVS